VFIDSEVTMAQHFGWNKKNWGNAKDYAEKWESDVWKKYIADGVVEGHDGIDYLICRDFFDCVKENRPMPIDIYDAATWMCISPLSEKSIKLGSAPVEIPDFKKRNK